MTKERIEHESFAVLQISRITGNIENLFGSSIQHQHFIELKIHPAYISRDLNQDWIYPMNLPYITIQMSNSQFAEAITSMNMGSGTPVTLKSLLGKDGYKEVKNPPQVNKRMQIDSEFEKGMQRLSTKLKGHLPKIDEIITKLPKKYQQEIKTRIHSLFVEIESNIPFVKRQFTEQMDKTTLEAKGEIEGFFLSKITSLGIKNLKMENVLGLTNKGEKK